MNAEEKRLKESTERKKHWKRWGPYLSERAWGTVREDYSPDGSAWDYFPHEDGAKAAHIAGMKTALPEFPTVINGFVSDFHFGTGRDRDLEGKNVRFDGKYEGNHGEDVKEIYYYLDSTPTHSYMKFLYKYPQSEFLTGY